MIRPATPSDVSAIAAIWNPIIRNTTVTFNTVEMTYEVITKLIETRPVLVSVAGEVAGFATYGPFRAGIGYRFVAEHTIMMSSEARCHGGGRALMAALEKKAKSNQIMAFWAGVSAENEDGVAFHKAIGFTEHARLPEVGHKFGRYLDLVLMQKRF